MDGAGRQILTESADIDCKHMLPTHVFVQWVGRWDLLKTQTPVGHLFDRESQLLYTLNRKIGYGWYFRLTWLGLPDILVH